MHNNGVNMRNKWNIKPFALYSLLVCESFFQNEKKKGLFVFFNWTKNLKQFFLKQSPNCTLDSNK
jgi:hypothetical protein